MTSQERGPRPPPPPEHPLHVLLGSSPKEGQGRLWAAFEENGYSFSATARSLSVGRLSLARWLRKFKLREEYETRRTDFARRQLEQTDE